MKYLRFIKKEFGRLVHSLFIYSRIEDIKGENFTTTYNDPIPDKLMELAKKIGIPTAKYKGQGVDETWAKLEEDIKMYADRAQGNFWALFALLFAFISLVFSFLALFFRK